MHHQAGAERPERRTEPGQPEIEPDDSRLFCLAERAGDQCERQRRDGSAGQSVEGARYQEHSTRLRERCKQGCANHAEGAEHEHATPAIDVTGNAAGKPAEACIKGALSKAKVPAFAMPTYSANVTVRPTN